MRIALTHPWCWPFVQRGGERLFADLVAYLARAGHDVTAVSAGPTPSRRRDADGAQWIVHRSRLSRTMRAVHGDQSISYLPQAGMTLRRGGFDVVHGLFHLDGVAARMARRPYLVHVQGIPRRQSMLGRPLARRLLARSLDGAAAIVTVSHAGAAALETEFGYSAQVLHNGLWTCDFVDARAHHERTAAPSILFPGDPLDPRKRVELLLQAGNRAAARWDGLRLLVAARCSPDTRARLESASEIPIEFLDVAAPEQMPAAYARAWATCNPAVDEAFGLVFVESMATGVPAVGVRDGGVGEVIDEPRWLAERDDVESLTEALHEALSDAARPETATRCQQHAAHFDWAERGPAFERLYREVVSRTR